MGQVLLVSSTDKSLEFISQLLREADASPLQIITAQSGNEARRLLARTDFEIIVINAPLSDEFGHELSISAAEVTTAGIIIIARNEIADDVSARVENYGVFVIPKPLGRQMFFQTLKLVSAARRRMLGLKNENLKLQKKIEEIRLIDRGKCALIQYLSMTEEQAHKYIERQAMDMRVTKKEVAEGILRTYET
ncbi:MAG: ANTAR domain-containing response regulator [Acetanaerobacterium sp.]